MLQAWETANFQGVTPDQLKAMLDGAPEEPKVQTDEQIFAAVSQYRAMVNARFAAPSAP